MWLWIEKDFISFDQGHRVEQFSGFQDDSQFESVATGLAQRAAEEVQRYRQLFTSVSTVGDFYLGQPAANPGDWQNSHAAVACAIAGNATQSIQFFDRFLDSTWDERPEWRIAAEADAVKLKALAVDTSAFRQRIAKRVLRSRELQKLPTLKAVDFEGPAQSVTK
jgi:hypothetical protein